MGALASLLCGILCIYAAFLPSLVAFRPQCAPPTHYHATLSHLGADRHTLYPLCYEEPLRRGRCGRASQILPCHHDQVWKLLYLRCPPLQNVSLHGTSGSCKYAVASIGSTDLPLLPLHRQIPCRGVERGTLQVQAPSIPLCVLCLCS